jgi:3-oxoacyl-[acyl-carrier protein] reductase
MTSKSRLLEGKIALVTGASRGIGKSITERFASEGAVVYANCRQEGCFDSIATQWSEQYSTQVIPVYYDVTDEQKTKKTFTEILKEQTRLDIFVNNAGIMEDALIGMITEELLLKEFSVNVFSAINHLQLAARVMKRNSNGSIVNISSIVGVQGSSGQVVYSATKGAILSVTKSAAKELAEFNIRVNAIAPGIIETDLIKKLEPSIIEERRKLIGMGRLGSPSEVAESALYFASDLSQYVTGQILGVDGGAIL